ncbi:MAG: BREX-6 system BrxE protein [Phormidesmis sp. RL_2_1]|nr:BREX-6 system BrxE protein [Phormidesmis sp. RL_2_1]
MTSKLAVEAEVTPPNDDAAAVSMAHSSAETNALDEILTWQLLVAWAGEGNGELQRLGWWRTDLTDEAGGGDFFRRLLPRTWEWAAFEAAREAAILQDKSSRLQLAQGDRINTLFFWGFEIDEQLNDRLLACKHHHQPIEETLNFPLSLSATFDRDAFEQVLASVEQPEYRVVPGGREIGTVEGSQSVVDCASDRTYWPLPSYRSQSATPCRSIVWSLHRWLM